MAQDVVNQFGWLTAGEMLDGLGLAETTPGPLILVTEFVGFLAGYRAGGIWIGLAGVIVTLWATFVPCFLWIFAGAPFIDWIGEQPRLKGALSAITAAVVGVILNLSIWFALHALFGEVTLRRIGPVTIWQPDLTTLKLVCTRTFGGMRGDVAEIAVGAVQSARSSIPRGRGRNIVLTGAIRTLRFAGR